MKKILKLITIGLTLILIVGFVTFQYSCSWKNVA